MLRLEYVGKFSEKFRQKLGASVGRNPLRTEYHDPLSQNDFSDMMTEVSLICIAVGQQEKRSTIVRT